MVVEFDRKSVWKAAPPRCHEVPRRREHRPDHGGRAMGQNAGMSPKLAPAPSHGALPEDRRHDGSLAGKASARLLSDIVGLLSGIGAGVITARLLGPSGKGLFATLSLLGLTFAAIGGSGFGAAAVVRVGQRMISVRHALGATTAAVSLTSVFAMAFLWGGGALAFNAQWDDAATPLLIATAVLPVAIFFDALQQILNASERIAASSALTGAAAITSTASMLVLLGGFKLGVSGAVAATGAGACVGLIGCVVLLTRAGLRPFARWDPAHFRWAATYGSKVQLGYLAGALAGRFDLLLVFWIAGQTAAGYYSTSLTIGALAGMIPWAISNATFPRVSSVSVDDARALTVSVCRLGVVAGAGSAAVLAAITPFIVPLAFGNAFRPAIVPALILLPGGVVGALLTLFGGALAARGEPGVITLGASTTLAVMCVLDAVLIAPLGIAGAATAASLSSAAGLWAALRRHACHHTHPMTLRELLPHADDVRLAWTLAARLGRRSTSGASPPTR